MPLLTRIVLILLAGLSLCGWAQFGGVQQPMFVDNAVAWTPTNISGMKLWIAADSLTVTNTFGENPTNSGVDFITTLADKSGNGYFLRATNSAELTNTLQWHCNDGEINTNAYVKWYIGTSSHQFVTNAATTFTQPNTIFMVWSPYALTIGTSSTDFDSAVTANRNTISWRSVAASPANALSLYAGSVLNGPAASIFTNSWYIVTAQFAGTNTLCRTNGVLYFTGDAGTNSCQGFCFGNYSGAGVGGADFTMARLAEALFYNAGLSAADISAVERYLGQKYGITVP